MINHKRLFNIGDQIHALLTSSSHPNILIPIRGIVKDIKHDLKNPRYKIKIDKFYDSWPFIKKYFFDNYYTYSFKDRPRQSRIKLKGLKSIDDLMSKLENSEDENRYYIVVDSLMSFKFYYEMEEAFETIQTFIIHRKMNELEEFQTRAFYKGKYRIQTTKEWFIRARSIIDDDSSDAEYKKIVDNF